MISDHYIIIPSRVDTEETTIHIQIVAEDEASLRTKPYAFMLPGGPGANHSHYQDYACLKDVVNLVFYDPRGCGLSKKGDPASYTMENYILDLEEVRKYLRLPTIQLIGKSYGAMCALGYTLRFPDLVTDMVLAAGSPSFKNLELAKKHVAQYGNDEQKKVCEILFNGAFKNQVEVNDYFDTMDTYYSYAKRNEISPTKRPESIYPFAFEPLNLGFSTFLREFNFEDQLASITACKTLVLVGEHDWITPKEASQKIAASIPGAKLVIFPFADHAMEEDVADLFFNEMRLFFTRLDNTLQHPIIPAAMDLPKKVTDSVDKTQQTQPIAECQPFLFFPPEELSQPKSKHTISVLNPTAK